MIKVTDEIRSAAARLLRAQSGFDGYDLKCLEAIANGKRKRIDGCWWREVHGEVARVKLDKISALADPTRNPNEHERKVAETKLAQARAHRPPGLPPEPPPMPRDLGAWMDRRKKK
jgi:hypothetical protein